MSIFVNARYCVATYRTVLRAVQNEPYKGTCSGARASERVYSRWVTISASAHLKLLEVCLARRLEDIGKDLLKVPGNKSFSTFQTTTGVPRKEACGYRENYPRWVTMNVTAHFKLT